MNFELIVAADSTSGIGLKGTLPWKLSKDLKYFKKITTTTKDPKKQNAVMMGRNTWESIPEKFRPLPDRLNIVLTKNPDWHHDKCQKASSIKQGIEIAIKANVEHLFIIGGGKLYEQAIIHPKCSRIYLTQINDAFQCDTYFPGIPGNFELIEEPEIQEENGVEFTFQIWEKQSR